MKTTCNDIHKPECESREYQRGPTYSAVGRSFFYITCPFCSDKVKTFLWSIAGGGKRCDCGAYLSYYGTAHKLRGNVEGGC
jgi:hypothetical protein